MTSLENPTPQETTATPRWVAIVVVLLAAVSLVALGVAWNAEQGSKANQQALSSQIQTAKQSQSVLEQRLQQAEESDAEVKGEVSVITDRLKLTQGELAKARYQAKVIKENGDKQFAAVQQQQQQLTSALAAKASSDDVNKLSGDVDGVKTDLASTAQNLQMAKDQFGNLIARNEDEIQQLRRMGERNIYEFTISRKNVTKKVGDLSVELRGTNTRKQLFTLSLYVNDKRFEKRNRSVDEPIYFYTPNYQSPLELVINQVGKNKIVGYLSEPKVSGTPAQPAATGTGTGSGSGQ